MPKIEQTIAENVVGELDAGDEVPVAKPGMSTLHGGPGTTAGTNYAPGAKPGGGAVRGQHETKGTRPLAGDFVSPTCVTDDAGTEQARDAAFRATVAQVRIDRAIEDQSFRQFCRDPVEPKGYVSGLEHLQALQDLERNKS